MRNDAHPNTPDFAQSVADYTEQGWWGTQTLADYVAQHARRIPDKAAFVCDGRRLSWRAYDEHIDALAAILTPLVARGARFGLLLPDAEEFHIALGAAERCGAVAVGMGARSGRSEIAHLMSQSEARVLVMRSHHRERGLLDYARDLADDGWALDALVEVSPRGVERVYRRTGEEFLEAPLVSAPIEQVRARALGPNDLSMLNSTSGTTGRPKLVTQFANRWVHFSQLAFDAADFTEDDVMFGAVPGPFGFGLWTAHYAPAMLGMTSNGYLAATQEEARDRAWENNRRLMDSVARERGWGERTRDSFEADAEEGFSIVGTPEWAARRIADHVLELDVDRYDVNYGNMTSTIAEKEEQIRLWGEVVFPRVKEMVAAERG